MANSKFEYVKSFEQNSILLPNTYLVIRIDGRGFHNLCAKYEFQKPNDRRALDLMNAAAIEVMGEFPDIRLAYGVSDEFSFVLGQSSTLFGRRESKILTTVVSTFTSYYIHLWQSHFPEKPLSGPLPSFDGRIVQYPTLENIRDYLSWRQVDCHINNLYNTAFWSLQHQGGLNAVQAEETLKGTTASAKHEILFSRFKMNYNNELEMFKKGSLLYRNVFRPISAPKRTHISHKDESMNADISEQLSSRLSENQGDTSEAQGGEQPTKHATCKIILEHTDIIRDTFWDGKKWLLSSKEQ